MDEKKRKTKDQKSRKKLVGNITATLSEHWEQAKLPAGTSDQQNFETAAQVIVDFMDWHRIEEEELEVCQREILSDVPQGGKASAQQ